MREFIRDIRFGLRVLTRNPGFSLITIFILATGIGASSAIFSVNYSVLIRPLPYPESERLAMLWAKDMENPKSKSSASYSDINDWRAQSGAFEGIEMFGWDTANLIGLGEPERIPVMEVSAGFLQMLGVSPQIGRTFAADDEVMRGGRVVVLSHSFWMRRFNGSQTALGSAVPLNGESYTIVGVMPPGFAGSFINWPDSPHSAPELWAPIQLSARIKERRAARIIYSLGRLKRGVAEGQAQSEMTMIASRLAAQYPDTNKNISVSVVPLREDMVGDVRPALRVLLGASAFLLLIACANVATMLLAHAAKRQKEISVRAAIGASNWRVIRQLLTESLLLSLISCALGLLMAFWILKMLIAISPADVPRMNEVTIDIRALAFTLVVGVITAVVFGLTSIHHSTRANLASVLAQFQSQARNRSLVGRARTFLVIFEVSAALLLLVGALLMIRSFIKLQSVESGVRPENVLTMRLILPPQKYTEDYQKADFFSGLLKDVRGLPGIRAAAAGYSIPFGANNTKVFFNIDGVTSPPDGWPPVDFNAVSPGFFETLGINLRHGRYFSENDTERSPQVIIINETMSRTYWPGRQAVGQKIGLDMPGLQLKGLEIVGVVSDVRQRGLDKEVQPCIFVSYLQFPGWARSMYLVASANSSPLTQASPLRTVIWAKDKDQPITMVNTMEQLMATSAASRRFNMVLLQILAAVAMCLALSGVYGLTSYLVTQRTKEIAIRMALGAQPSEVLRLFVIRAMTLIFTGLVVGLATAFIATRWMESMLFEISATDTTVFLITPALLLAAALFATIVPTRRVMKINPASVLRSD